MKQGETNRPDSGLAVCPGGTRRPQNCCLPPRKQGASIAHVWGGDAEEGSGEGKD